MQTPRTEFAQALKALESERGLSAEVILDTIKQAIIAAYKRDARERGEETEDKDFDVLVNSVNGETRIFAWPIGEGDKREDITPPGFGRIAAQTAKQVIHQKIREAEKTNIMGEFEQKKGNLVSGIILRFDGSNVRVDLSKTEGIMPSEERVPNERLNSGQRLTFLLKDIVETPRGKDIILSRADVEFVRKLFAREVPEIGSGTVEIRSIAREPGVRTKMTVYSTAPGVDPVGSCVGQKGVRVQAVTNELGGERVDIIPWSDDLGELIKGSLSPADDIEVVLDTKNKTAKVYVPEDQLSLAIGKDGQNARLAAKLTDGYRIEIDSSGKTGEKKKEQGDSGELEEKSKSNEETKKVKGKKIDVKEEKSDKENND